MHNISSDKVYEFATRSPATSFTCRAARYLFDSIGCVNVGFLSRPRISCTAAENKGRQSGKMVLRDNHLPC